MAEVARISLFIWGLMLILCPEAMFLLEAVKALICGLRCAVMLHVCLVAHLLVFLGVHFAPFVNLSVIGQIAFRFCQLCLFYALRSFVRSNDVLEIRDINFVLCSMVSNNSISVVWSFIKWSAQLDRILLATILLVSIRRAHLNVVDTFIQILLHGLLMFLFFVLLWSKRLLTCINVHLVVLILLYNCIIRIVVTYLIGCRGGTA